MSNLSLPTWLRCSRIPFLPVVRDTKTVAQIRMSLSSSLRSISDFRTCLKLVQTLMDPFETWFNCLVNQTTVSQSTLFDFLNNEWHFKPGPTPDSCHLFFVVDFQFKSALYRKVCTLCFFRLFSRSLFRSNMIWFIRHFVNKFLYVYYGLIYVCPCRWPIFFSVKCKLALSTHLKSDVKLFMVPAWKSWRGSYHHYYYGSSLWLIHVVQFIIW